MKHQEIHPSPGSHSIAPPDNDVSRRNFLKSAAIAGVAAVSLPIAATARSGPAERRVRHPDPVAQALSRYGSEFGDLSLDR